MPPPVQYVKSGEVNIAYQVVDGGPHDILMIPGWVSHLELEWEEPCWVRWCERLTRFARLVRFDKRGTGLSDRPGGIPNPDERMEDARAVMDAVDLVRAHVMGWSEGGPLAIMLAVTHPERVQSLILSGTQATFRRKPDYPFGLEDDEADYMELERSWGSTEHARFFIPDGDTRTIARLSAYLRAGASPSAAVALARANGQIDVRPLLGSIRCPVLVLSRSDDPVAPGPTGRYLAECIPGARFVELPGSAHHMWFADSEALCSEIEEFVTGVRPAAPEPGAVRAVLQCDIEGSTELARQAGDERWADLLEEYGRRAEAAIAAHGGRLVDRTGDGLMATFEGPVNAIRAAKRLQQTAGELDVRVRAGVHIGEVVERDGALRGIAVHLAARVMSEAGGGEVLASETVRDIVAGSGLSFVDRGVRALKGIEGSRRLYAVV
jgi:class 3 adenylate cyclase